jgi:hypothetical protein
MVARLKERRGEWSLIEFGPLIGWTRSDLVDEIE